MGCMYAREEEYISQTSDYDSPIMSTEELRQKVLVNMSADPEGPMSRRKTGVRKSSIVRKTSLDSASAFQPAVLRIIRPFGKRASGKGVELGHVDIISLATEISIDMCTESDTPRPSRREGKTITGLHLRERIGGRILCCVS